MSIINSAAVCKNNESVQRRNGRLPTLDVRRGSSSGGMRSRDLFLRSSRNSSSLCYLQMPLLISYSPSFFCYSELHCTVPDLVLRTGHPAVDATSMSRAKIGGRFRGYVEDIAALSGCRDSPAHRAGFHRHLQHSRRVVDVRVLQVD